MPQRRPWHGIASHSMVAFCCALTGFLSLVVILGWVLDIHRFRSLLPGYSEMKFNAAICLLALAVGLYIDQFRGSIPRLASISRWLGGFVIMVAVVTLAQYVFYVNLGIDQLFFQDMPEAIGTSHPGRMAPQTAFNFLLKGLCVLMLDQEFRFWPRGRWSRKRWRPAQVMSLLTVIFPIQILTAYAYGVRTVLTLSGPTPLAVQMSIPVALAFLVLSVATLFARPKAGVMAIVTAETPASVLLRKLLPVTLCLPFALGWSVIFLFGGTGQPQGYNAATLASLMTVIFTIIIYVNMARIARAEVALAEANDRLAMAHEAALAASAAKSTFLATMSHELRTPLTAIIGYSELMQEEMGGREIDSAQAVADLARIRTSGEHLLQLVDNVLDLSKIEAGRMELREESVDLRKTLGEVAQLLEEVVQANGNQLTVGCPDATVDLWGGALRLKQILVNLGSNAAKFTHEGRISISCNLELTGKGGEARALVLVVADTGIGVAEEFLPRMFEVFAQQDPSSTRRFGGSGLGLAITKRIVDVMGGTIEVTSKPKEGTAFTVRVPLRAVGSKGGTILEERVERTHAEPGIPV